MRIIALLSILIFTVGCSTVGRFNVPKGHDLYVYDQKVPKSQFNYYKRRPLTWGTAAGVRYMLKKDGKVVEKGTLKTQFRVVSIFWPPVALAYWPMGFSRQTYDFTEENLLVRPTKPRK